MTNHSKKRKFLATTLTASMVAAAVAPVAGVAAAENSPFPDVPADHNYAGVITDMVNAGVIEGLPNGNFDLGGTITRAQAAQMVAGLLDLKVGEEENTTKFEDVKGNVWYTGAINSLVDKGIVKGKTDTSFEPGANITRGELAQLLVVAYGLEDVNVDNVELPFTDVAEDAWFAKPIKILYSEGLIKGQTATTFGPKADMKRGDFTWLAANVDYEHGTKLPKPEEEVVAPAVESVSAINANQVEVKFTGEVKDTSEVTAELKKGFATQYTVSTWAEDKKSVVLEAPSTIAAGDYEVVVTGLSDETSVTPITIEEVKETSIDISNITVSQSATALVNYDVLDQYGSEIAVVSNDADLTIQAYNVTKKSNVNVTKNGSNSDFTLDVSSAELDDEVRVTVSYKGITSQKTLKVVEVATAADIELGLAELKADTKRFTVNQTDIKLPYVLKDQFGKEIKLTANSANAAAIAAADGVTFVSSDNAILDPANLSTDADGNLLFDLGGTDGSVTLTAIINSTGDVSKTSVVVNKEAEVKSVSIAAPSKLVAVGETVELNLSAVDQFGEAIDSKDALISALIAEDDANSTASIVNGKLQVVADGAGSTTVTLKNGADVVGKVTFTIEAAAVATAITGVDVARLYENGGTDTLTFDDVKVKDQYGRDYTLAASDAVTVAHKDTTADNVTFAIDGNNDAVLESGETLTFTGTTATNNEVISFTLANGAKYDLTVASVATADITSYSIKAVDPIYAQAQTDADYDVTLTLVGKTAADREVALADGKVTHGTTSNSTVATVSGSTVTGLTVGTSTIALWNNGTKLAETAVTVTDEAPRAVSAKIDESTPFVAVSGAVDGTESVDVGTQLEVLDQYGVDIADPTAGFWYTSDTNKATVTNGVVTAGATTGEVTITYVTTNGIVTTTTVTVQ